MRLLTILTTLSCLTFCVNASDQHDLLVEQAVSAHVKGAFFYELDPQLPRPLRIYENSITVDFNRGLFMQLCTGIQQEMILVQIIDGDTTRKLKLLREEYFPDKITLIRTENRDLLEFEVDSNAFGKSLHGEISVSPIVMAPLKKVPTSTLRE